MKKHACDVCGNEIKQGGMNHTAGFPERIHTLCSEKCLRIFLKMEDDELMDKKK